MTLNAWWLGLVVPVMACVGVLVARLVWVKQYSPYDRGVPTVVGESGRHGFDASIAFAVVPLGFGTLAVAASAGTGSVFEALVMIGVVGLMLGFVECLVLLLFLWPRHFVPPHLREKRGWIAQAMHNWRGR